MAFVYLIKERDGEHRYKIGSTRSHDVSKRLKQLQTGNSSELTIEDSFETETPFKLEKMLHNNLHSSRVNGEWFELEKETVENFKQICESLQGIIDSLKDNPFYSKK